MLPERRSEMINQYFEQHCQIDEAGIGGLAAELALSQLNDAARDEGFTGAQIADMNAVARQMHEDMKTDLEEMP